MLSCSAARAVLLTCLMLLTPLAAQERTRSSIPDAYRWNLVDLYASDAAWQAERERLAAEIPNAATFRGTLASGGPSLQKVLDTQAAQAKSLQRLAVYAGSPPTKTREWPANQGRVQQMSQLNAAFGAAWAYLEPEIQAIDPWTVQRFVAETPGLAPYRQYLRDVLRRKPHTLPRGGRAPDRVDRSHGRGRVPGRASVFRNADLPYPTVKLADGREVRLDVAGFSAARASTVREDRRRVMEAFFGTLGQFNRTLGATMNANVEQAIFLTKAQAVRVVARARSRRVGYPRRRLPRARRRRESPSADVPPVSAAP